MAGHQSFAAMGCSVALQFSNTIFSLIASIHFVGRNNFSDHYIVSQHAFIFFTLGALSYSTNGYQSLQICHRYMYWVNLLSVAIEGTWSYDNSLKFLSMERYVKDHCNECRTGCYILLYDYFFYGKGGPTPWTLPFAAHMFNWTNYSIHRNLHCKQTCVLKSHWKCCIASIQAMTALIRLFQVHRSTLGLAV